MSFRNMEKSNEYFQISKKLIPGGVQTSRHPRNFTEAYPIFTDMGNKGHIWDVDGNEYIDWMLSFGPIILGHCNKEVDDSVKEVMKNGFVFDLTSPMQLTLIKKIVEHIPCAEKAIVVTTGSEATSAAVRIARIHTGKKIIIKWGYHGWHDWCSDNHEGIPNETYDLVKTFRYNDLNSLEKVLEENKNKVACIIMMPFEIVLPDQGFLEGVREMANNHKVVLIFDEIRSWPRLGLGGAQKYFGVTPDIATISKGIANGYPISLVVGKAKIMDAAEKTAISATYFPSKLGMSAALATIKKLEDMKVMDHISNIAIKLGTGLRELIENKNVKATVFGVPQMPFLMFGDKEINLKALNFRTIAAPVNAVNDEKKDLENNEIIKANRLKDLFYNETIKRGVFFHPNHHWFSCFAHTDEDVDRTLKVSEEALDIAIKNLNNGI